MIKTKFLAVLAVVLLLPGCTGVLESNSLPEYLKSAMEPTQEKILKTGTFGDMKEELLSASVQFTSCDTGDLETCTTDRIAADAAIRQAVHSKPDFHSVSFSLEGGTSGIAYAGPYQKRIVKSLNGTLISSPCRGYVVQTPPEIAAQEVTGFACLSPDGSWRRVVPQFPGFNWDYFLQGGETPRPPAKMLPPPPSSQELVG